MVATRTKALVIQEAKGQPKVQEMELPELGEEDVTIKVNSCGLCHTDLLFANNGFGMTQYPYVGGHEIVGEVCEVGNSVENLKVGDRVGLGWYSSCCNNCDQCINGYQNTCESIQYTIVVRYGGFADLMRCKETCATKIPDEVEFDAAGPLLCAGITVFYPLVLRNVRPTDTVGVVGIGGLGHLAIQFLRKWGCHVAAFTSNPTKQELAKQLGAHEVITARAVEDFAKHKGRFDFIIICTSNVTLDWNSYISMLAPNGNIHFVGTSPKPLDVNLAPIIFNSNSLSASPVGSLGVIRKMLMFCARHGIKPMTESFKLSELGKAFERLESGKARFRIILHNDLA